MKFLNQLILSSFTTLSFSIVGSNIFLTSDFDNRNFASSVKENKREAFGAKVIQAQQKLDEVKKEIGVVNLDLEKNNKSLEEKTISQKTLEENIKKIQEKIEELTKTIEKKTQTITQLKKSHREIKDKKAKLILKEGDKRKKLVKRSAGLNLQISRLEEKIAGVKGNNIQQKIKLFLKFKVFNEAMKKLLEEMKKNNETEKRINVKKILKAQIDKVTQEKNQKSNLKNTSQRNMNENQSKATLVETQIKKLQATLSTKQELLQRLQLLNTQAQQDLEKSKESFYSIA